MARLPTAIARTAAVALICLVASCATGERPSFSEAAGAPGRDTGDAAIDAVLERLDRARSATFTGEYEILTRYGNITSDARVVQAEPDRRAITVGGVRFVIDGASTETCRDDGDQCVPRVEDSFVSDLQVTHRFYAEAAAANLRQAAGQRLGAAVGSKETFAGRPATCVEVAVSGGAKRFCALDSGVAALVDDAAVRVTLTGFSKRVDDAALGTSR